MSPLFWAFILLGIAALLFLVDLFLPTAGIVSFLALIATIAAIVVAFTAGPRQGAMMIGVVVVVAPLLIAGAVKFWPHTPIGRLILIPSTDHPDDVLPELDESLSQLVGRVGKAKTKLLPSGAVVVDGKTYDALSVGKPIEAGQPVRVVRTQGRRVVVQAATEADLETHHHAPDSQGELLAKPIDEFGIDSLEDPLA